MEKITIKAIKYRTSIFVNVILLLTLCLIGLANAQESAVKTKSDATSHVEKNSSSNIHVDEIPITTNADGSSISEEVHKRLVSKLSIDAEKEVSSWVTGQFMFGTIALFLGSIGGIWAFFSSTVERKIEKQVDKLDKKREEASETTIKVKHEIDLAQETLKELRKKENEINGKLEDFHNTILEKETEISRLNLNLDSIRDELEEKITAETFRLEQKNKVLRFILKEVDGYKKYESQAIEKIINDLNYSDEKTKYNAAELLPQFEIDSNKITDTFIATLKSRPDKTLASLLLSGLSELRGDKNTLNYLLEASNDLNNPNLLEVIGALGKIGENGNSNLKNQDLDSIIKRLILLLNDDLESKYFSDDSVTASRIKSTVALALSNFGDRAESAVNDLVKLLSDNDQETRKNAAISLGTIGSKAKNAIRALGKMRHDEYAEVREAASEAIEKIQEASN